MFFNLSDGRKSRRHVDDIYISDTMAAMQDLRDAVRICHVSGSGVLSGIDSINIEYGSSLRRLHPHVGSMMRKLGMKTTTPLKTPEVKCETNKENDDVLLSASESHV